MSHAVHAPDQPRQHTNRLAQETSPYLLQHQHNPVDWYPWGPEAFEIARRENKPIFLSVGYSTCYWCHVMERQCFEVESVAGEMNRRFVNIKVDREERPDVDQLYMLAVQVLTHRGGWPMSVWLTPELKPFYGGTYFPPPQFLKVLAGLDDAWQNRREEVAQSSEQLTGILQRLAHPPAPNEPIAIDDAFVDTLVGRSVGDYEPTYGGFGNAPKFPRETVLEMLLTYLAGAGDAEPKATAEIRRRVLHALDAMAHGGIRDHLGGGFHRYSTDEKWLVPHFEIMLYDNAMLAWCYAEAFRQTGDERYAQVARDVFDFILREMTSPDGAFYTAFDAEVDGQEGLNYLWTKGEVDSILGADAAHFNRIYGLDHGPNFADPPHGNGVPDKSILFLAHPGEGTASALLDPGLRAMRQKLYEARQKRKQPLLDTKILTSWNALMIRAFAHGSSVLKEPRYLQAGERAADFLLQRHRTPDGGLYRTSRGGKAKYDAFLDDYAFLAQALLALQDAGADMRFKREGVELAIQMLKRFGDEETGGFYFTAEGAADLIVRQKTATDSPLPSGNAVAALVLLSLGQIDGVRTTLAAFAQQLQDQGEAMSSMVQVAVQYLRKTRQPFTVSAGAGGDDADRPLSPQQVAAGVVSARAEWAGPRELHVHLSILRGFHINGHEPGADGVPLIPTRLVVGDGADVSGIDYPPGEEQRFAFAEQPVRVYSGNVTIAVNFRTDQDPAALPPITLSYQACDDSACLPPVTKPVEGPANPA